MHRSVPVRPLAVISVVVAAIAFSGTARAEGDVPESAAETSNKWRYQIELYAFIPFHVSGDAMVRERVIPFSASLSDLFAKFEFGAALHFEAWKKHFGLIADTTYLHVGQSGALGPVDVDWDSHSLVGDLLVGFRPVVKTFGSDGALTLEIDGGGRLAWLDNHVTIGGDSLQGSNAFGRAVVGGRIPLRLSKLWVLGARGYLSVPNPGWSALGWVELDPLPWLAVVVAYKVEHVDWDGAEASLRATAHGPFLGVGFNFGQIY